MTGAPDKYRIRMSMRAWYVRQYTNDGRHVADHGPYVPSDHAAADAWAQAQGWTDWDKMQ